MRCLSLEISVFGDALLLGSLHLGVSVEGGLSLGDILPLDVFPLRYLSFENSSP